MSISFARISTKSAYEALTPVQDRLYFIDETGELYMNGKPYNGDDGSRDWLCFTAEYKNSRVGFFGKNNPSHTFTLEYSTDGVNWTDVTIGTPIVLSNIGDKVYFRGNNNTDTNHWDSNESINRYYYFSSDNPSKPVACSGNVMSIFDKDCKKNMLPGDDAGIASLFEDGFITTPPKLPATTLNANYCYANLFKNCSKLREAPELPATTLTEGCYQYIFEGCTSLVNPPELPALTMKKNCYKYAFHNCTALVKAPYLPAKILANECYSNTFEGCTALQEAPAKLPAMSLMTQCYQNMFKNCSSLKKPPILPATTMAENCYSDMFSGSGLTEVCELPATTLAVSCYGGMFANTKITTLPLDLLPATTLAGYCYQWTFAGCTSLTIGCRLPATTLAQNCYAHLYEGCSSLTDSERIGAETLASGCMYQMFKNCTKLCRVWVPNLTSWDDSAMSQWMSGLSYLRRAFVCNANLDTSTRSESRIPESWIPTRSAYGANALISKWNVTANNFTFCPCDAEQDWLQITTNNNYVFNAIGLPNGYVGSAQGYVIWYSQYTSATLTAGDGITFIDTPRAGYVSHVLVTWSGSGNAQLRVMWETAL